MRSKENASRLSNTKKAGKVVLLEMVTGSVSREAQFDLKQKSEGNINEEAEDKEEFAHD